MGSTPTLHRAFHLYAAAVDASASVTAVMLAHAGGWDELALVGIPLAVFSLLLLVARNRARAIADAQAAVPLEDD